MAMAYGRITGVDRPVSRLVLGCGWFRPEVRERAASVFEAFRAAGGTAVDTAFVYGTEGASERTLGDMLAAGGRDDVVVITKGAHHDAEWRPRVTASVIDEELRESLRRLRTDHVDLYLLHRDDPAVPVGDIVSWLNAHADSGATRAFGGSNWRAERLRAANAWAEEHGLRGMSASSPHLALAIARDPAHMAHAIVSGDAAELAWYREHRFPLLAWTSQAGGFFSDRADPADPESARRFRRFASPDNWERRRRALDLAARRGCTGTQVALAWVLHQGPEVYAIIGPGSAEHVREAVGALDIALSPEEVRWLADGVQAPADG